MSLLFIDGQGHYATADFGKKWDVPNGASIVPGVGRSGGSAIDGEPIKVLPAAIKTGIVGVRLKRRDNTGGITVMQFYDAGTGQCYLGLNGDGTFSFYRNGNGTPLITSVYAIPTGTYVYLEIKVTIDGAVGIAHAKVNGAPIFSLTNANTQATANATFNSVKVSRGGNFYACDVYMCDTAGTVNNDFLGDCRVDTIFPSGNGNSSQLVNDLGNSVNNFSHVNEAAPDGDTSYVQSATVGEKDTYAFGDITHTPVTIFGVQVLPCAEKDDAGARSINAVVRSGGADTDEAASALATGYLYYPAVVEKDPNTSALWTKAALNAAEFGVKVAA